MKTVAVIQARMASKRLPGKVLLELGGQTVLHRVIRRLSFCQYVDEVVVATTDQNADDPIVSEAERCRATVVRGSESDVLSRYYLAGESVAATDIVRITADCPLIDPQVIDQLIMRFRQRRELGSPLDYLSNVHPRTFPRGLDAEIFTMDGLRTAHIEVVETFQREHVTPFFYLNPTRFRLENMTQPIDQSSLRWTLDEPTDLAFFQAIYRHFSPEQFVSTELVLQLLSKYPKLSQINALVEQKELRAA